MFHNNIKSGHLFQVTFYMFYWCIKKNANNMIECYYHRMYLKTTMKGLWENKNSCDHARLNRINVK